MTLSETTASVQKHQRFDYWHEVICRTYVHIDAEALPSDRSFGAELAAADMGQVTLSRVRAEPHCVRRSAALIELRPHDTFMVSLMLRGEGVLLQDGREVTLRTGDASLYDGSRPFELALPQRFDMVVLQFGRNALLNRCPLAGELTASCLPAGAPAISPLSTILRSLQPSALGEETTVSQQLGVSLLDILSVTLAEHFGTTTAPGIQRKKYFLRACSYINEHVDDASLNPSQIASATGMSVRYLHMLFRENNSTVTKYMFRRRLARCYDDLVDPAKLHLSVTSIAHAHGFKTSAHFARKFADTYGRTPSSVRPGLPTEVDTYN